MVDTKHWRAWKQLNTFFHFFMNNSIKNLTVCETMFFLFWEDVKHCLLWSSWWYINIINYIKWLVVATPKKRTSQSMNNFCSLYNSINLLNIIFFLKKYFLILWFNYNSFVIICYSQIVFFSFSTSLHFQYCYILL